MQGININITRQSIGRIKQPGSLCKSAQRHPYGLVDCKLCDQSCLHIRFHMYMHDKLYRGGNFFSKPSLEIGMLSIWDLICAGALSLKFSMLKMSYV